MGLEGRRRRRFLGSVCGTMKLMRHNTTNNALCAHTVRGVSEASPCDRKQKEDVVLPKCETVSAVR